MLKGNQIGDSKEDAERKPNRRLQRGC